MLLHLVGPDIADLSETLPEEAGGTADRFQKLTTRLSLGQNTVRVPPVQREPEEELERLPGRLRALRLPRHGGGQ